MDREALVYVDLDGVPHLMARHGWKLRRDSL